MKTCSHYELGEKEACNKPVKAGMDWCDSCLKEFVPKFIAKEEAKGRSKFANWLKTKYSVVLDV